MTMKIQPSHVLIVLFVSTTNIPLSTDAADARADIEQLVDQLGSEKAEIRDAAEAGLGKRGVEPLPQLFDATLSNDPERARRARRLIARLEGEAFPLLARESESANKDRAEQAQLLLSGLTDRLLQRKIMEITRRIEVAAEQGRVTESEQRNWISQLNSGKIVLTVDQRGRINETGLERQLECREALSLDAIANKSAVTPAELEAFRKGGELPDAKYAPAWKTFVAKVGEGPEVRGLFADMVAAEPALIEAAAEVFTVVGEDAEEATRRGQVLGGLYDLRDQDFRTIFQQSKAGQRWMPGKPFPDVYDDVMLGRLTSFLFIRSELSDYIPTPTLGGAVATAISDGMAGFYTSKQPFFEMMKNPADERAKAIRRLLESAALTAKSGADLQQSLSVSMLYRLREVCRTLAARILDEEPERYSGASQQDRAIHLAAHALLSFGKAPDDLPLLAKVLDNPGQIRGGYRKEENRPYMEVREMALMAVLRLLGRRPQDIGGVDRVTGYCPIRRFTQFDAIRDSDRWTEINSKLNQWIEEAATKKP
jgi:hypothetical protein